MSNVLPGDGEFVTPTALAEVLGLSLKTIRRMIAKGDLPAYRVGKKTIRIRRSDAEAFISRVPAGKVRDFAAQSRPTIACLCGSTRFMDYFHAAAWELTLKGEIVLSVGVAKHVATPDGGHAAEALGDGVPEMLDELHKRKIDLCDYVLVLNVDGYIGSSTRSEIEYAEQHSKPIRYLYPDLVA
jgi:excisionase family DNA binding protein